jgi:hypothetical protein
VNYFTSLYVSIRMYLTLPAWTITRDPNTAKKGFLAFELEPVIRDAGQE